MPLKNCYQPCPEGQCLFPEKLLKRKQKKSNCSAVWNRQTPTLGKPNVIISCWTHCWAETEGRGCGYADVSFSIGAVSKSSYSHLLFSLLFFSIVCCHLGRDGVCGVGNLIFNLCAFCSAPSPKMKARGGEKEGVNGAEGRERRSCSVSAGAERSIFWSLKLPLWVLFYARASDGCDGRGCVNSQPPVPLSNAPRALQGDNGRLVCAFYLPSSECFMECKHGWAAPSGEADGIGGRTVCVPRFRFVTAGGWGAGMLKRSSSLWRANRACSLHRSLPSIWSSGCRH